MEQDRQTAVFNALFHNQGENCRGMGVEPPSYIITPQLTLLEVPQGVGHNPSPPTMTNVNKCMG